MKEGVTMKKLLSILLVLSMLLTMLSIPAMAEEMEIIAFSSLDETEKKVETGTPIEDLKLPEVLTVTVRTNPDTVTGSVYGSEGGALVDIPVTWTSQPEYDMNTVGKYVFTPVIEGYTVRSELPKITVTVEVQTESMTTGALLSSPVGITSTDAPFTTWKEVAIAAVAGTDYEVIGDTTIIKTAKGLAWFANDVNDKRERYTGKVVELANDIDLECGLVVGYDCPDEEFFSSITETNSWIPIGDYYSDAYTPFEGTFDGKGHTISGVKINRGDNRRVDDSERGLFSHINNATIKNLGVINSHIVVTYWSIGGGIVACMYGSSVMQNCYFEGDVIVDGSSAGGLAGVNQGTIQNCYNKGIIFGGSNIGGLVGNNTGVIENCYNIGTVSGLTKTGSLVGSNSGVTKNCYWLSGSSDNAVGYVSPSAQNENLVSMTEGDMKKLVGAENALIDKLNAWVNEKSDPALYQWKSDSDGYPVFGETEWCMVTFDTNGHGTAPTAKYAVKNTTIILPTEPTASGYKFAGWFTKNGTGDDWGDEFTAATPVTGDITVYARWIEKSAVTITEAAKSHTYDGTGKAFEVTGTSLTGFTVEYYADGAYTTTAPINAGKYKVRITRAEDENYTAYSKEIVDGLEIRKLPVVITWSGTEGLVYTGSPATISADVSNKVMGDTVNVTLSGETGTDAGTYNAAVTAVDNNNYTLEGGANLTKTWSIAKATNEWTTPLSIEGWVFGEAAKTPVAAAKFGTVQFTYSDSEDGTYTESVPTSAGTYYAKATVPETENYSEITAKVSFVISKQIFTVTVHNGGYGTASASPTSAEEGTEITLTAIPNSGYVFKEWSSTDSLVFTDGSKYTATAKFIMPAKNITVTANWTSSSGGGSGSDGRSSDDDRDADRSNSPSTPSTPSSSPSQDGVDIFINEKKETAATATTTQKGDKTVTTVIMDDEKVGQRLAQEGSNTVVTIPFSNGADVAVGQLNGQTVKNMENLEAVLEIKTDNVMYTIPASQINIDAVSQQIGEDVELKDITVSIKISEPAADSVRIMEDTANANNYLIAVEPVEFEITCSSGSKTVEVSKFNAYVERMIAIPEGIDSSKITTGVIVNPDGSFSHVPTVITIIDGKYYAKINSLTNSTYLLIYSPKTFKDIEKHWAREAVDDMASRLVVNGAGEDRFEPDRDITRGEFAAIVVRALGLMRPGTGKDVFSDVSKDAWYYDAVTIAYEYNLIAGYGNGQFEAMDKITREQAMTIVARAMNITKLEVKLSEDETRTILAGFTDANSAAGYAKTGIAACVKTGIIFGRNKTTLAPKENITRAEAAVIIRRLLQQSGLI